MTYVLNRNFYIRSPADVHSQCFVFSRNQPTLQFFFVQKAFAELSYHCVSFKDEVEVRWISLGPYPLPPISLSQADGIQSIDTIGAASVIRVCRVECTDSCLRLRVAERWGRDGIVGAGDAGEDAGEESGEQQSK